MAEVKSIVCDMCGASDAQRWQIGQRPLKPWVIDLCAECAAPLHAMRQNARSGEGGSRPYRRLSKTPVLDPQKRGEKAP